MYLQIKDTEYLISFSNVTKGSTFTLAETKFEAGEVRSNPIAMTGETYTLGEYAANLWLKFEVTQTGVIDFGCDIPFDYNNFIGIAKNEAESPVSMADDVHGEPVPGSSFTPRMRVYQCLFPVTKGDILYIQVNVPQNSKGKKFTLTQRAPEAILDSKPTIYTLDGTKIDQINGNGVYIIKMNGKTKKLVIKK